MPGFRQSKIQKHRHLKMINIHGFSVRACESLELLISYKEKLFVGRGYLQATGKGLHSDP